MPELSEARILVVDDEARHVKALCDTLRDQGGVTTGFTLASEALSSLRRQQFDLLLTDLMMPEMSGIDLLRAALEIDPQMVCIMMTGHAAVDTAVEAMRAGALDYILKPFKLNTILPVLTRALAVRSLRVENEALQRSVRARSAELEARNKELEAFSYSVSHDLRAPLRAIDGFAHMLQEDYAAQLSVEGCALLNRVSNNVNRMSQLIDDLLHLARLGRQPLSKQPVNVVALVHEVLEELRNQQDGRPVEVRVGALPGCVADPSLLKQVFINLLSNAYKFTRPREQPTVKVGCIPQDNESVYFVQDNGVGFDMSHAGHLFGAFQRLHRPDEFEGTGIGLSIVHRVIQRHGGRIWTEAAPEKGATFYFTLPDGAIEHCG